MSILDTSPERSVRRTRVTTSRMIHLQPLRSTDRSGFVTFPAPGDARVVGRRRSSRGAAVLEFALIGTVLITLLIGIISFGLILAFNQNITQAAAEGARAGAIAVAGNGEADAEEAVQLAVDAFGETCGTGGLTCEVAIGDCGFSPGGFNDPAVDDCVTVTVSYDYENNPILPDLPLISALYPNTLTSTAVAQVNPITSVISTTTAPTTSSIPVTTTSSTTTTTIATTLPTAPPVPSTVETTLPTVP